jgi:hypothetical protein
MGKLWPRGLLALCGVFALIGLVTAVAASGNCLEEVSATLTAPEGTTFTVSQTKGLTIDNNGQNTITVSEDTAAGYFEFVGTACGTISGGGSCSSQKVKCLKEGESKVSILACDGAIVAYIYLKCD